MRKEDIGRELTAVSRFVEEYLSGPGLANSAYARELFRRADETFVRNVGGRQECETCATELLQFSRALELITVQNQKLLDEADYYRDFTASVAALKRVAAAVRLRFLLVDLQAIVEDGV